MPHTTGPWAYDPITGYVVSTVEHEDWSVTIHASDPDEELVPMRIASLLGALNSNCKENLALIVAAPLLLEALKQWKCKNCGGRQTYLARPSVPCTGCGGTGLHPIARAAIEAAEGPYPVI